jgi:DNA-binding transcriptional regulator of glucitol operon
MNKKDQKAERLNEQEGSESRKSVTPILVQNDTIGVQHALAWRVYDLEIRNRVVSVHFM